MNENADFFSGSGHVTVVSVPRGISQADRELFELGIHVYSDSMRLQQIYDERGGAFGVEDLVGLRHVRDLTEQFTERLLRRGSASDIKQAGANRGFIQRFDEAIRALEP